VTTAWAHLPNAKHIDWVLESLKTDPDKWFATGATWRGAWREAWLGVAGASNAAQGAVWNAALDAVLDAAQGLTRSASRTASRGVILALITYDDCAYMIESDVGELKILAAFGDTKAILLLPACIVYNEEVIEC
jgi:hypothetical protein